MSNNKIFVSYRRQDASGEAGRLVDHLQEIFGEHSVFLDVETIEAGLDFVQAIDKALSSCKVLIAMIGPYWTNIKDSDGNLRLFKEDDFIRLEVAAALERDIRVIPVLVNGAIMPSADQLPENLKALTRRHAHELSSSRWQYDSDQLAEILKKIIGYQEPPKKVIPRTTSVAAKPKEKSWLATHYLWILGAFVVFLIIINLSSGPDFDDGYLEPEATQILDQPTEYGTEQDSEASFTPPSNPATEETYADILDVSGYWILQDNFGNPISTFFFEQNGDEFSFVEYNLFEIEVGSGDGYLDGNTLFSDYFSTVVNFSGEINLQTSNSGKSWAGSLSFPTQGTSMNVILSKD
ncbi:toll/interleukin-1 receptor domain-containing protein [Algoriphagus zhangzhouensis]|uniref:TIR domain-containing protein n=1 Tax=Algoriphagus zhangzhouensis TaxID=1073327 RepID=A0A1M7Z726_9BACT|nr:toll/interleukin-1 receptor domain-containing protein [Algoriphagus zhangzhouensis]TDY49302.1 TIR domain-containing protein [Algoriphagus zhangzhouensis]SHO60738.1 TIR domain-containing protein [Algoriphagus zhangzhouensis]